MKTFIADIIPKIQQFSKKLDYLTRLTNQHWVSLNEINQTKRVFIFRANNQLLIADNGIVEKGSWEYLSNQSLLIDTNDESYLLKLGFFDENVIAFKLDNTNNYTFFINETKYNSEFNSIGDILKFLEKKYLKKIVISGEIDSIPKISNYILVSELNKFDSVWGNYTEYKLEYSDGLKGEVYKSAGSKYYFYVESRLRPIHPIYESNFEQVAYKLYKLLRN